MHSNSTDRENVNSIGLIFLLLVKNEKSNKNLTEYLGLFQCILKGIGKYVQIYKKK